MQTIAAVSRENAHPKSRQLLDGVRKALGMTPNMMATMAVSPAVLDGYLALNAALGRGTLTAPQREQIALAVAEANSCDYCLAAHSYIGKGAGLSDQEILESRQGRSEDPRTLALLALAQEIVETRGRLAASAVDGYRARGLSDAEIAEVVAHVALNVFTNYFNLTSGTEVDFPAVSALEGVA
jgi:uncharacterized peroxidase-related enzyme